MKREIRDKRDELRQASKKLRELAWECDYEEEKNLAIRKQQDDSYKRFKFFDGFIKANENARSNND